MSRKNSELKRDELRRNSDGSLDEVVVHDADLFHLEQMDDHAYWVGLTRGNRTLHLWIQSEKKGRLSVTVTDDELGCHDHVTRSVAGRDAAHRPLI